MMRGLAVALVVLIGCSDPASGDGSNDSGSSGGATTTGPPTTGSEATVGTGASSGDATPTTCNGSPALCDRTYDTVIFPGTHNSHSATESGFAAIAANQTHAIPTQLEDGIRVLLLDVYEEGGETLLCHGLCGLGSTPHVEVLGQIRDFLEANPNEVLTIIYEDHAPAARVEADFEEVGLVPLTYVHAGGAWPTLGDMITAGTRLVITAEEGGPPPAWFHHVWDLTWDTPYTFMSIESFTCDPNRGDPDNPLFLLNHWVSTDADLPDASAAAAANALDVLLARVDACPRRPTFIAVDFYDQGDLLAAVDALQP